MTRTIIGIPEDVLLYIFLMCSDVDSEGGDYSPKLDWDWITVTHVCEYWRDLALSYPLLWCRPTLARHSRDRLEAFFARSQNAPLAISTFYRCEVLDVDFGECTRCQDNAILALHHLPRIRHLSIVSANSDVLNGISEKPAPLLQDIQLSSNSRILGDKPICLSSGFVTCAPSIKSFNLTGFYLPYDCQSLRGLECLKICHYSYYAFPQMAARCYPSLHEALNILSASPTLQELDLFTIRGPTSGSELQAKHTPNSIHLHSLYSLKIEEMDIRVFEELLKYIEIPLAINISVGLRFAGADDFDKILDILVYIGEYNDGESLNVRQLNGHIDLGLTVDLEAAPAASEGSIRTDLTLFQVDEDGNRTRDEDIDYEGISEMTMNLIRCSNWNNVAKLSFTVSSHYSVVSGDEWSTFLDAFRYVEDLHIRVHDLNRLFDANFDQALLDNILLLERNLLSSLTMPPIQDDTLEETQSTYVLPCLEKLFLDISSVSHFPTELLRCMKRRSDRGQPVRDLRFFSLKRFTDAEDHDNWISEIEKYVDQVKIYSW